MSDTTTLIAALENAPGIIIPLIREVPPQYLKRRPSPTKWSPYEHACHLSGSVGPFLARLDLMLSAPEPYIKSIVNSPEEESGALLSIDLDESLDRYVRERADLVKSLKELSVEDWRETQPGGHQEVLDGLGRARHVCEQRGHLSTGRTTRLNGHHNGSHQREAEGAVVE
jgi:hypothetical protein